jgi:hypothetical protein
LIGNPWFDKLTMTSKEDRIPAEVYPPVIWGGQE